MGFTHTPQQGGIIRYFFIITCSIVAGTALAGLIMTGSPTDVRRKKFDDVRINDLQIIQSRIIEYWQLNGTLPRSLAIVKDASRAIRLPSDPETKNDYFYQQKGGLQFELCTIFSAEMSSTASIYEHPIAKPRFSDQRLDRYESFNNDWTHDAGYWCFSRIIDQDYYERLEKQPIDNTE